MKKTKPALEHIKELLLKVKIAAIKQRREMVRKDTPAPVSAKTNEVKE